MSDHFPAGIKITQTLIQEKLLQANGYQEVQCVTAYQRQIKLAQPACLGILHFKSEINQELLCVTKALC